MKKAIRSDMIKLRDTNYTIAQSDIICKKITEKFSKYDNIAVYMSIGSEVKLDSFINLALSLKKTLFIPKIIGNNLEFGLFDGVSKTNIGHKGIKEPIVTSTDYIPDIILIPGLAFDKQGGRIGYGKGFYDRYLENKKNKLKVGIAYYFQIVENTYPLEHDVKMDYIVTDKEIIKI